MPYRYRQSLPDTPLDIVGDVHGEFAAFQSLLHRLGYRDDGFHPRGRRLVFVGDLCDRGHFFLPGLGEMTNKGIIDIDHRRYF